MSAYQSPHGRAPGLPQRLAEWADRMAQDNALPWAGLGIIGDIRMAVQILSNREWLEKMRVSDDPDAQRFADELLGTLDELDTIEDAAAHVRGLPAEKEALPGVETIEALDALAVEREQIRQFLIAKGILADDDHETPLVALLGILLA